MEVLYSRCGRIDVHERFVVVCLSQVEQGHRPKELRRFGTMTGDLQLLRTWLLEAGCTHVAMESTGIYWRPVYDRLYGYFELIVTNAQHMKAVKYHNLNSQNKIEQFTLQPTQRFVQESFWLSAFRAA